MEEGNVTEQLTCRKVMWQNNWHGGR